MQRFQRLFYETIKRQDGLKKYDVVVVGNLTAGHFARQFYKQTNDQYSILLVNNQMQYQLQQGSYSRVLDPTSIVDGTSVAITNGVGLKSINFEGKSVNLQDGRSIEYNRLVVAQERVNDFKYIPGLVEALQDPSHPVYCQALDFNQRNPEAKNSKDITNFSCGNIFYYIPQFPFQGQEDFVTPLKVFELLNKRNQAQTEKLDLQFMIITPNESLFPVYFAAQEKQYRDILERNNIKLLLKTELSRIDKHNKKLNIENTATQELDYDAIFFQGVTSKPEPWIKDLLKDGVLDINQNTLQHNKYKQVFSIGPSNFNSFYTNQQTSAQIELAKVNILMSLQGQQCVNLPTSSQSIFYYVGGKQIQEANNHPVTRLTTLRTSLTNRSVSRVFRYVWQSTFRGRLQFLQELQQRYITNRLYGAAREQRAADVIQITTENDSLQETTLEYAIPVRKVDTTEIKEQLRRLNLLYNANQATPQQTSISQSIESDTKTLNETISQASDTKTEEKTANSQVGSSIPPAEEKKKKKRSPKKTK